MPPVVSVLTGMSPAGMLSTTRLAPPPRALTTAAVPSVGCPANGIS